MQELAELNKRRLEDKNDSIERLIREIEELKQQKEDVLNELIRKEDVIGQMDTDLWKTGRIE